MLGNCRRLWWLFYCTTHDGCYNSAPDPYTVLAIEKSSNHPCDIPHKTDHQQINGQRDYVTQGLKDSFNSPPQVYVHAVNSLVMF